MTERPEGWELKNAQKMWRPMTPWAFEWRWGREQHCDQDMGDPHQHCPKCGGVLQVDHAGGQPCVTQKEG